MPLFVMGLTGQAVVVDDMVHDAGERVIYRAQVGLLVALPGLGIHIAHQLRLPCQHVGWRDVAQAHIAEERQDLIANDGFLGAPGIELEPGYNVGLVDLKEVAKLHGCRTSCLHQKVALPLGRIGLTRKAALSLFVSLPRQVLTIPALDGVDAVLLLAHRQSTLSWQKIL